MQKTVIVGQVNFYHHKDPIKSLVLRTLQTIMTRKVELWKRNNTSILLQNILKGEMLTKDLGRLEMTRERACYLWWRGVLEMCSMVTNFEIDLSCTFWDRVAALCVHCLMASFSDGLFDLSRGLRWTSGPLLYFVFWFFAKALSPQRWGEYIKVKGGLLPSFYEK